MYRLSWECVICVPQAAKILSLKDKNFFALTKMTKVSYY